jgi:hypothetical protein
MNSHLSQKQWFFYMSGFFIFVGVLSTGFLSVYINPYLIKITLKPSCLVGQVQNHIF